MSLLVESIRIENGKAPLLDYHLRRIRKSSRELYGCDGIDLEKILSAQDFPAEGIIKCRIVFDAELREIEWYPYKKRKIIRLDQADIGDFLYKHKYLERDAIDKIRQGAGEGDEFILTREGMITDTTFSNVALYDGQQWYTPEKPLLYGVRREKLLDEGRLITDNIHIDKLYNYHKISFINAMLDLGESEFELVK
jgi:4-amino-4-deoxychorismate lyase